MKSILQDWVMELGLRHQGVLLGAVRGCDSVPREDPSKGLIRALRAAILVCHCGDPAQARTFIEEVPVQELEARMRAVRRDCDHLPHHFVMHLVHAAEIVGYFHPTPWIRDVWHQFYHDLCRGLHLNAETYRQLNARLSADEETFGREAERTQGTFRKYQEPEPAAAGGAP